MIHIRDDDLIALFQVLPDGEAHDTDEGSCVHAEGDFVRISGIEKKCHVVAGARNRCIDFLAPRVPTTALHVSLEQVTIDSIEYDLGNLGTSRIIKEDELR